MNKKNLSSMTIALLLFIAVFGITNIPSNYANLGNSAIGWFILLTIYFIPLALIIGELSAQDVESKSGMFGWIRIGLSEKWAFLGAWSYFIVNVFYLPMLASRIPVLFSWTFTADIDSLSSVVSDSASIPGVISAQNHIVFIILAFVAFLLVLVLGMFFEKFFSSIGKIVGWISLFITGVFIVLALITVPIQGIEVANQVTLSNMMPTLSPIALSTFAWILFAIAGIETVGSYTPYVERAEKRIPKAILLGAVITTAAYILGFVAISNILTPNQVPLDSMENMIPIMFAQIGDLWNLSPRFLRVITLSFLIITLTSLVLWLNATVISLFEDFPSGIIDEKLQHLKINNIPIFGFVFTAVMVLFFLLISTMSKASNIYYTLYDMTTVAVLLPYVLIAASYIAYCKSDAPAKIIKNKKVGLVLGWMIMVVTILSMFFSIFDLTSQDLATLISNALLLGGGLLFFMIIGVGIYLMKINKNLAYIVLIASFGLAGIFFNVFFLIFAVIIFALYVQYLIKKNQGVKRNTKD